MAAFDSLLLESYMVLLAYCTKWSVIYPAPHFHNRTILPLKRGLCWLTVTLSIEAVYTWFSKQRVALQSKWLSLALENNVRLIIGAEHSLKPPFR